MRMSGKGIEHERKGYISMLRYPLSAINEDGIAVGLLPKGALSVTSKL